MGCSDVSGWCLLSNPIPKPLARPGGCSGLWHKSGVAMEILQAGDFSGPEDQEMLEL